uniref:Uncharacterized protein n=1 Tax=Knipowitschia caucasica TaxID=637954 RepID=A0AAV2LM14_KNICA
MKVHGSTSLRREYHAHVHHILLARGARATRLDRACARVHRIRGKCAREIRGLCVGEEPLCRCDKALNPRTQRLGRVRLFVTQMELCQSNSSAPRESESARAVSSEVTQLDLKPAVPWCVGLDVVDTEVGVYKGEEGGGWGGVFARGEVVRAVSCWTVNLTTIPHSTIEIALSDLGKKRRSGDGCNSDFSVLIVKLKLSCRATLRGRRQGEKRAATTLDHNARISPSFSSTPRRALE